MFHFIDSNPKRDKKNVKNCQNWMTSSDSFDDSIKIFDFSRNISNVWKVM